MWEDLTVKSHGPTARMHIQSFHFMQTGRVISIIFEISMYFGHFWAISNFISLVKMEGYAFVAVALKCRAFVWGDLTLLPASGVLIKTAPLHWSLSCKTWHSSKSFSRLRLDHSQLGSTGLCAWLSCSMGLRNRFGCWSMRAATLSLHSQCWFTPWVWSPSSHPVPSTWWSLARTSRACRSPYSWFGRWLTMIDLLWLVSRLELCFVSLC